MFSNTIGFCGWKKTLGEHLNKIDDLIWKSSGILVNSLLSNADEFNAKMLHKRFEFLVKSSNKLDKILPDFLKSIFKTKQKLFNSYMLTEILLESNLEQREKLKYFYFLSNFFFSSTYFIYLKITIIFLLKEYKSDLQNDLKSKLNNK